MLVAEPEQGRCHFADLEVAVQGTGSRPIDVHARLIRGERGKFALQCRVPEIGEVALGQGRVPWMVAGGKTVLVGTKKALGMAVRRQDTSQRYTALRKRLAEA